MSSSVGQKTWLTWELALCENGQMAPLQLGLIAWIKTIEPISHYKIPISCATVTIRSSCVITSTSSFPNHDSTSLQQNSSFVRLFFDRHRFPNSNETVATTLSYQTSKATRKTSPTPSGHHHQIHRKCMHSNHPWATQRCPKTTPCVEPILIAPCTIP